MKILILCTGNSCRSKITEGFLKSIDEKLEVYSAGTKPADKVNPFAVKAMNEIGIDISNSIPENVEKYIKQTFDFVITVCDNARESCPIFTGDVKIQLHIPFYDPADASGTEDEIMPIYRKVRDEIKERFNIFYEENILDPN
ncbi:MAG: arsenate reductase ArsC [Ignavibacteria bacterium]|nr:arsenate reductase ArsC [Ignavibacteria bacterium]MBT8384063.1 arsenate reductase ArsC [Ignavibacteria bacterium]MBT8390267.1 arsenate reductase ArsC [Ignavibacteria bacterium]NNJ53199.1 arsenate reductase ArsC [Ignavibacteriaceae bacterium]NNL22308.1 arsenate reductase ArsC [Ignavibacteriaceae bacterium]